MIRTPVHEQIFAPRMTVNVTVEQNVSALKSLPHHHLGWTVLWTLLHAWCNPLSIEVKSTEWAPIVADNHPVWIKHGNNFEHEVVSQVLCSVVVRNKVLQHTLYNVWSITLSRMNSASDDDGSSNSYFFRSWTEVCDDCHFTVVSRNSLAHNGFSNSVFRLRDAQSLQQFSAIWVSVGIAVSHVHFIIIMHKLYLKSKSVIKTTSFFLEGVLEVANVLSISVPPNALPFLAFSFFLGVEEWLHALVIWTLRLDEVDEIELVGGVLFDVTNFEVEPLRVIGSVVIILQNKVILVVSNFNSSS